MGLRCRAASTAGLLLVAIFVAIVVPSRAGAEDGDREAATQVTHDLGRAVRIIASDFGHVTTAPARLDARGAYFACGFLAAAGIVYAYDEEIIDWIDRNREEDLYDIALDPGRRLEPVGLTANTMVYYIGGAALTYAVEREHLFPFFADLVESHAIAGLYKNLTNYVVGRARPFEEKGPYFYKFDGGTSFPSGHSQNIFIAATVISHHVEYLPVSVVIYALAASTALERLDSHSHWPSDVLIGAAFGTAVARTVVGRNEERRIALSPAASPISGAPGVAIHIALP